jgi:hypothetical protein
MIFRLNSFFKLNHLKPPNQPTKKVTKGGVPRKLLTSSIARWKTIPAYGAHSWNWEKEALKPVTGDMLVQVEAETRLLSIQDFISPYLKENTKL